jgi:transcriptional regulator with XRE-family HTH domain
MYNLYENIYALCKERGITPGGLCGELGFRRSVLSDLKNGRKKSLDTTTLMKIAEYFNVSVDYLLTGEETKKALTDGERKVSDDDIMFALWGDSDDVDKDDLDDVKRYAAFVRERKKKK